MRVDDFLSEYVGIDLESESYTKAIRCLSSIFLEDGILKPDDDLVDIYQGEVDWTEEAKEFREAFRIYVSKEIAPAYEFLHTYCKVPDDMIDVALIDLADFFDILDDFTKETDIYKYIEYYFEGSILMARDSFLASYQY